MSDKTNEISEIPNTDRSPDNFNGGKVLNGDKNPVISSGNDSSQKPHWNSKNGNKTLVLVDGYSLFFRAYYAIKGVRRRSDGMAVNGIYGFTRMLMNILLDLGTAHLGIIFDTGGKTFRHEKFPSYKTNRPPVPEDMKPQFPLLRELCEALNLKALEKEGYEADDVIATLTREALEEDYEVWIVSGDKDLMQLVSDRVCIYDAKENRKLTAVNVKDKWGVDPSQLLDLLSLMGDNSDNVPGVPGIGPKTAAELVNSYGDTDNIIANVENIRRPRLREAIRANADKLLLSRDLIRLNDKVAMGITIDELAFRGFNPIKFRDFLKKMEFSSILKELDRALDGINSTSSSSFQSDYQYKKVTDLGVLDSLCRDLLSSNDHLFFNLETKSTLDYKNVKTICFSDEHRKFIYYLRINDDSTENSDLFMETKKSRMDRDICLRNKGKIFECLAPLFGDKRLRKISFGSKRQIRILKFYGVEVENCDDIGCMSYLLDNGIFEHSLSNIINKYLINNVEFHSAIAEKYENVIAQLEKGKNLDALNIADLFDFSCAKLEIIGKLYGLIGARLGENAELQKLYEDVEKPLIRILALMEFEGVRIDIDELSRLSQYFNGRIGDLERRIFRQVGQEFNINSPRQLGDILFEKMNLPGGKKSKKSGYYGTDVEILQNLYQMGFDIAGDILEYRHYLKLKNTYTDSLPKLIDGNGRVHTTYLNTAVITGRLSSSNPNLQNIPIRTEDGEKIRHTFIAKNGYSFIGADYSQIELRILAQYADVKQLKENFLKGLDIHRETAKNIFHSEEVTPEMRRLAKAINFSIVYGTTSFGLAKRLDKNNMEAKSYMDNYFNTYPEVATYMEKTKEFAHKNGFVKTMFGRICHINLLGVKEPQKSFLERLAINAPIQGTGADIIKMAMVTIYAKLASYDAKILLQVHDELLLEVKNDCLEEVYNLVKNTMENVVKFDIPLPVDIKIGHSWADVH